MKNSIFVSYNPNSAKERDLAEGLYKKGRQNGFFIFLPERISSNKLTTETKTRIDNADWFVVFSTVPISNVIVEEINYALKGKQPHQVVVIYSKHLGRNIPGNSNIIDRFTSFDIDEYDLNSIEQLKSDVFSKLSVAARHDAQLQNQRVEENNSALKVILGIGLAALLLAALDNNNR